MAFDPKAFRKDVPKGEEREGGERDDRPPPAGPNLFAMVSFKRMRAQDGGTYLRGVFPIIYGPAKGRTAFVNVSLALHKPMAAARFASYCEAVGDDSAIDERDMKQIAERFKFRGFKADLVVSKRTGDRGKQFTNYDFRSYIASLSSEEQRAIDAWEAEARERREEWAAKFRDGVPGYTPSDDDGNSDEWGGDDGGQARSSRRRGGGTPRDDDGDPGPSDADAPPERGRRQRRQEAEPPADPPAPDDSGEVREPGSDDDIPW